MHHVELDSTVGYFRQLKSRLNRFVNHFRSDILIEEITPQHISEFKGSLLKKGLSGTTLNSNMDKVMSLFKIAVADDTISKSPFRAYTRSKTIPSNRTKLTDDQIETMRKLDLPTNDKKNWLHNTRNYYLFSYFNAGIRVADLIQLRVENISDGRLEYEMDKTGHKKSIALNMRSLEILKEYLKEGSQPKDYLFPILDNAAPYAKFTGYSDKRKMDINLRKQLFMHISANTSIINNNLAIISEKMKLDAKISFHTSRHSFADKARRAMKTSNKITIVDIMNALGHKSISTTQIYLNTFDKEALDEAMEDIFA